MIRLLYFASFPIFCFPISFCVLFYMLSRGEGGTVFLFFALSSALEYKFSSDVISHCSNRDKYDGIIPHIAPVLLLALSVYIFSKRYEFQTISGSIAVTALFMHALFKWYQVKIHTSEMFSSKHSIALFKYGRMWDSYIPNKKVFEFRLSLAFAIVFYNFLFVITTFTILVYATIPDSNFYHGYKSIFFLMVCVFSSALYYTSSVYLMISRGFLRYY